jgi:putative salt-induced outer membrane protein YdiY
MRRLVILFVALAYLAPTPASAGIINVQSILATEADEGLSGSLSGSADWRTGNVDFLFLSATPVARYRAGDHLWIGIVRLERKTTSGDTVLVSRTFEHLRYRYRITDRVLFEGFGQHTFDAIRRLNLRAIGGAGGKVDLIDDDKFGVAVGVAYMLEYERIKNDMEIDAGDTDLAHRASSYLTGHYALDDRVQLVETFYAQPKLTDFDDTRILSESQLVFKLTKRVSFSTAFTIAYDTAPPETIDKLDTALQSTITVEL